MILVVISFIVGRIRLRRRVEIEFGPPGLAPQEPSIATEPLPTDFDDVVRLISWEVELAPLVGRDRERAELLEWAQDNSGPRVRIRLLTGPGGSGKSRLAADVARALKNRPFWRKWRCVGVVGKGCTKLTSLPAFLIIDDADDRRSSVLEILEILAQHRDEKRAIRVLLLSRTPKERWDNDLGAAKLRGKVDSQEAAISPLTDDDAAKLYQAVTLRLATTYRRTEPHFLLPEFKRWLSQNALHHFPLYLTAAALHAVRDADQRFTLGARALIVSLAQRELDRLRAASTRENGFGRDSLPRLAAIAIIRGGLDAADIRLFAAANAADEQVGLLFPRAGSQIDIVEQLRRLPWWSAGSWQISAPDVVAASILYEVWKNCDVGPAELLWLSLQGLGAEGCSRVGRLGYDIDLIYGHDDGKRFATWLAQCVRHDAGRAAVLEPVVSQTVLPLALRPLAIEICRTRLSTASSDEDRSRLLNNLSVHLSDSGDRAGALRAIEEAVKIRRRLAQAKPTLFEPDLAGSLSNFSNHLSKSGDRVGALRAIEEAVEIYRRLAQAQPTTFEPPLAMSLNNLSNHLGGSGERAGALRAIEEAVEIYRRLTQAQPMVFEPALASSLNNLSVKRSDSGDRIGALSAIEEAVKVRRRLANAQPAAFEPDLAGSLNNLSNRLTDSGDRVRALCEIEEAVKIRRRLAQAEPTMFEPDLAGSLNNLSVKRSDIGDRTGALRAIEEAVEIYRRLAQAEPTAFEPDLAGSLNNFSNHLSESGDRVRALCAIEEAVEIHRRLAQAQSAAFEPALATSLNNLSNELSNSGNHAGALCAIEDAVKIRRQLAKVQPAAFEPDLAGSLNNFSNRLSDSGDSTGALRAIEEAVEIYWRLAQAQPTAFEPALAMSLNNLSYHLSDSGDRAGALRAIQEAVLLYRRLAEAQPAAFEPDLARSLRLRDALTVD